MKPISIRFRCFGPYRCEQFVDFTALEQSGVFLITGETGAGKTTILDAMCYALYGRSSGGIRGDLTAMRCKLATRDEETLVEFVFEVNARRYCFTRSLKYARKNINDSHNCMILEGDTFVPLLENPKATYVNKKAEELIGLTYDQFRQVIILPQGQFEKLLVSDSAGKEAILVSLFRAENWQRIADEMGRRVNERDALLKTAYAQWTAGLRAYDCATVEELTAKLTQTRETVASLTAEQQALTQQLTRHKELYETALLTYREFEECQKRRIRLQQLTQQSKQYDAVRELLHRADIAESIRAPYEAFAVAQGTFVQATRKQEDTAKALRLAEESYAKAQSVRAAHERGRAAAEQQKRELALYENARGIYSELAEKQQAVHALRTQLKMQEQISRSAVEAFDTAHRVWLDAMATQQDAITRYQTAQQQYLDGIGGVLAQRLVTGEACPVCGSTEHPAPALPTSQPIREADLDALNEAVRASAQAVQTAAQNRTKAESAAREAGEQVAQKQQQLAAAQAALDSALKHTIDGIDTVAALENAVHQRRRAIAAYEQADAITQQALNTAAGNVKAAVVARDTAAAEAAQAQETLQAAQTAWETVLHGTAFASADDYKAATLSTETRDNHRVALASYTAECQTARALLSEQETKLEGCTCPDVAALKAQYVASSAALQQLHASLTLATNTCQTMAQDVQSLAAQKQKHDRERERVDADMEFVRRLQGRTGVSLQRYVLGVMLSSITVAANRLLKNVHGGRYQLYRTDEIAGSSHKGGLELEVYDAHHNERRSVTTLSGGEKFLVSLSLAIGLSTVVQAQGSGVRIEAMFVDEGFGSLDRDSISDALEILGGVTRGKGVVGIISHVEQLAETIGTKIVITKGKDGSECRVTM